MEKQNRSKEPRGNPPAEKALSYESALQQLEEILDKMNGSVSLEDSVSLYERADQLLKHCSHKLGEAESKIETLVKNRAGEFALGTDGRPQMQPAGDKPSDQTLKNTGTSKSEDEDDLPF